MKKLIIILAILALGSAVYAQSNPEKKEAATGNVPAPAASESQKWAAAYQQTKTELDEAQRLIGQYTMQIQKMENLLNDTRTVLIELARAKTIEERDAVLKKYKLENLNAGGIQRDGGTGTSGGGVEQH